MGKWVWRRGGQIASVLILSGFCTGCGTVIGLATDTAIAIVKIPFKVGGAVIDMASRDPDKPTKTDKPTDPAKKEGE